MTNSPGTESNRLTRRRFVQATGAASAVGLTSVAGCTGSGGGGGGLDEIRVAYMPIYPDMQYFVMQEEEYFSELDVEVSSEVFSDGPSIVQASAKGDFDVMMFGIVPAMIVIDKGIPAKITAANIQNAMQILAHDDFAALWEEHGADAFAEFEAQKGRKFTFGTFPPGSVPDILLRYWLTEEVGVEPGTDVEVTPLGGAGPVRQSLLAEKVDGTSIMEPVPTVIEERGAPFQSIAWAGDFMPGQPAAVTLMHDRLRSDNPEVARAFVEQHQRATDFTKSNKDAAAADASAVIGKSSLPVETARKAMDSPASDFVTDPHAITDGAKIFSEYAVAADKVSEPLSNDALFDLDIYDGL
ncbi:NitT/TauT family transport system substrate-binding protein [Halopelagius inordinatus]|uniref:NitT/TauT family transport system substrate-binding protein n=1 Tax=Halopelagius inordinatus TaxID=553467 RepID=A0A1I2US28_9EURY|nr:ABC transporter substrate-binding protein [Halopelagius inordinatus]SFG78567.1 NitT/TauT family transport system substrate-binding protein [Halopelagius inordinatus]